MNSYEEERLARIAENRSRMEELGILTTVAELRTTAPNPKPKPPKELQKESVPLRRSSRIVTSNRVNHNEDAIFQAMGLEGSSLRRSSSSRGTLDPINGISCHYCRCV